MDQKDRPNHIIEKIKQWEQQFLESGFVANESELLSYLDKELNPETASKVLTLAALSRLGKNSHDHVGAVWLEQALNLNPDNLEAKEYRFGMEWKKLAHILSPLSFPSIRETDNRTAKKKIAEEYIEACQIFLNEADDYLTDLHTKRDAAARITNQDLFKRYNTLFELLSSIIEETGSLLLAAEGYEQSITGVFHTSTYYDDLKLHLHQLDNLKSQWEELFLEENLSENSDEKQALDQLHDMIGMDSVKKRVNNFYQFLKYQKERKELGLRNKDELSLNMILTGNPGTGKTTLARLMAKIYFELGVFPREKVVETNRSQLVGSFVGQTEENVRMTVERAIGGVLFIDEAYSLKREGQTGNDYGQAAVDTLVSLMTGEEYGGKFAVILAGYPEEMRSFLDANTGLRSRFPHSNFIHLPNYSNDELIQIAEKVAAENDYFLTEEAKLEIDHRIELEQVDETFGNARTVHNIVLDAVFKKGSTNKINSEEYLPYMILDKEDFLLDDRKDLESPYEKLNQLIGLGALKDELKSLMSFVKMQQLRRNNGFLTVPIQLHAVFTGNPGTGKTTVAKIYAELLRDCGFLKRGHLIVASRADFVAGYVGQTAAKTKKKIREALGGVLFIDEAYSLLGQTAGDFGKEVIDTLVDEMTKQNENLVVVLAGYPNEMNELLESNPGLRSRFKKFFLFPDYSAGELLEIMDTYARSYQYELTEEAKNLLLKRINLAVHKGNGRFASNLVDEMIQVQASRLMKKDEEDSYILEMSRYLQQEDVVEAFNKL